MIAAGSQVSLCAQTASADSQRGALILKGPEVIDEYQVLCVSPNGQWACGNVNDGVGSGWRWNLETGVVERLSSPGVFSAASAIADDGTAVGMFLDSEALGVHNGSQTRAPGYYRDGKWHHLDVPDGYLDSTGQLGAAWGISPNGRFACGLANIGGEWLPISWDLQEGTYNIDYATTTNSAGHHQGSLYAITDDGTMACGFSLDSRYRNRTPAFWTNGALSLLNENLVGPWGVASAFSPDGTKVLAYTNIYDVTTGTLTDTHAPSYFFNFEFHAVGDDGALVGEVAQGDPEWDPVLERFGVYYKDGEFLHIDTYFASQGADLTGYTIYQVTGMSQDQKTFVVNTSVSDPASPAYGYVVPIAVCLDQPLSLRPAVALRAHPVEGSQRVVLTWEAPLSHADSVFRYDIYRDDTSIGSVDAPASLAAGTASERRFVDPSAPWGEHQYAVQAIYGGYDAAGAPALTPGEMSRSVSVSVTPREASAPRNLLARQAGAQHRYRLTWDEPLVNAPALRYYDDGDEVVGFGGATTHFEIANRYPGDEVLAWGTDARLCAVSFVPTSLEADFTLNIYKVERTAADAAETMTLLASQPVDKSQLYAGRANSLLLDQPIALSDLGAFADLLVAIDVDPGMGSSYDYVGTIFDHHQAGLTDLIRVAGEPDFYSLSDAAAGSASGAYTYDLCWPISLYVSTGEASLLQPAAYEVMTDSVAEATDLRSTHYNSATSLTDGPHDLSVRARYADGTTSPWVSASLTPSATDYSLATGVDSIDVRIIAPAEGTSAYEVRTAWQAPEFRDHGLVTYASDVCTGGVSDTSDNTYQAGAKYPASLFRAYEGDYRITGFRFYPTGDCEFTLYLNRGNESLAEVTLDYGTGYVKNQWNVVPLPEPIPVDARCDYSMVIDMYDILSGDSPLGLDDQPAVMSMGDLYSDDFGASWKTLYGNGGSNANWMMGLVLESDGTEPLDITRYVVSLGNSTLNLTPETPYYNFTDVDGRTFTYRVDTRLADGYLLPGRPVEITVDAAHVGIRAIEVLPDDQPRRCYDLLGRPVDAASHTLHIEAAGRQ